MFYIAHENGVTLAARAPDGEIMSPRWATDDIAEAYGFDTWGQASEAAQNFGPDWNVEEV